VDVFVVSRAHIAIFDAAGNDGGIVHAEVHREVRPVSEIEIDVQPSAAIVVLKAVRDVVELLAVDFGLLLSQFCLALFVEAVELLPFLEANLWHRRLQSARA